MDEELWQRIVALHARVENLLGVALQRRHGLGLSEYRALGHLAGAPDRELRMQDLAERVGLNQSSVTRLAGRLESAGFTYRDMCPDDRRGVYSAITEQGRTRYEEARGTYQETLTAALDAAATDPDLAAIVAALRESA